MLKSCQFSCLGLICLGLLLSACGHRSDPTPTKPKVIPTLSGLSVTQRGDQIRLIWQVLSPIPKPGLEQFVIEERILQEGCANCSSLPLRYYLVPFPSPHLLGGGNQMIFYLPPLPKDLYVHLYRVHHQTVEGQALGVVVEARLKNWVEFPTPPELKVELLSAENLEGLRQFAGNLPPAALYAHVYRFFWTRLLEKAEIRFGENGSMLEKEVYYGINLYKTQESYPWPEQPLVSTNQPFYIFYQPQHESQPPSGTPFPRTESFFDFYQNQFPYELYYLRLVDSAGNESEPSAIVKIPTSLQPYLPASEDVQAPNPNSIIPPKGFEILQAPQN